MQLKKGSILLVICMVLMVAPAAMANIVTISDTTLVQEYNGTGPYAGGPWVDIIGASIFETKKIDVVYTGNDVKFQIYTNFPLTGDTDFPGGLPIADLALDLDNNGFFEKGIVLTKHGSFSPGLYSLSNVSNIDWSSSVDLFKAQTSYAYGGRYDQGAPKIPLTQIFTGSSVSDPGFSVVQNSIGGFPTNYRIDVDLGDINSGGDWNNLSLFWGTGICSNDGIAGHVNVPEPAALLLLGFGLVGMAWVGRKVKK